MSAGLKIDRVVALLRYHRPSQFAHRVWKLAMRGLPRKASQSLESIDVRENKGFLQLLRARMDELERDQLVAQIAEIRAGKFTFLNETRQFGAYFDWLPQDVARLWTFHLHYHEFLLPFACVPTPLLDNGEAWSIVLDWIERVPMEAGSDAWHPFCISRRIPTWMMLWNAKPPNENHRAQILASLVQQTRWLRANFEWDLRGNHLLENIKGLTLAATFFAGSEPDGWLDEMESAFESAIVEQILPWGEHYERSPMYHSLVLEACLDMRDVLQAVRPAFAEKCGEAALEMAGFLERITHPDGQIPLFGDSSLDTTPNCETLCRRANLSLDRASGPSSPNLVGDYWINRRDDAWCIFDTGPVAADELPAHGHCDLLNIELSLDGVRIIVDSGNFDYEDSEMRRYCRSTAAHNTLQVDDNELCDVWSRFRMGRRGHPVGRRTGHVLGIDWCYASHDAFRHLSIPTVGRWVAMHDNSFSCVDHVTGQKKRDLSGSLHFHPRYSLRLIAKDQVRLSDGDWVYYVRFWGHQSLEIGSGWYCPGFGIRRKAPVVRYRADAHCPAALGWVMSRKVEIDVPDVHISGERVCIRIADVELCVP